MVKIITDHKWKQFKYAYEVPTKVLESEFDYQDREEVLDGFFSYRGSWYHIDSFMNVPKEMKELNEWHGYSNDSFYSGIVIQISKDGEEYRVGTFIA